MFTRNILNKQNNVYVRPTCTGLKIWWGVDKFKAQVVKFIYSSYQNTLIKLEAT